MSINYQQIRQQVRELGMSAPERYRQLQTLRQRARELLDTYADDHLTLREKVLRVVRNYDPSLRCALPVSEALDAHFPAPPSPGEVTILAADGSQINPDRHAEVEFSLINVGAIQVRCGSAAPPVVTIESQLFDADGSANLTENSLALQRDLRERDILSRLAAQALPPVVSFTDGPMELWGSQDVGAQAVSEYQEVLREYIGVLEQLRAQNVATAGYVDKPAANLVVRLLEVAEAGEADLPEIKQYQPLRGVRDFDLYAGLLDVGERSAIFALQSQSARQYTGDLALHFFYLNVGRPGKPWLARVEVPAWVAKQPALLDNLHAVLVDQCRLTGERSYPYLLHRAHEIALVGLQEREQVAQMIALELRRQGVPFLGLSHKQALKNTTGRTRFQP